MHRPVHPKQEVIKIVGLVTVNYGIVLSSVLFGYGTFICIRLIFFCNSVFIQMKFMRKTFFSKCYFSNLVIC